MSIFQPARFRARSKIRADDHHPMGVVGLIFSSRAQASHSFSRPDQPHTCMRGRAKSQQGAKNTQI